MEGHSRLARRFPAFATCPLHTFLQLVGAIARSWEERSEDRPSRCPVGLLLPPAREDAEMDERRPVLVRSWTPELAHLRRPWDRGAADDDSSPTASAHSDLEGVGNDHRGSLCVSPVAAGAGEPAWPALVDPAAQSFIGCSATAAACCEDEVVTLRLLQDAWQAGAAALLCQPCVDGDLFDRGTVQGCAEEADAALAAVLDRRAAAAELEAWAAA